MELRPEEARRIANALLADPAPEADEAGATSGRPIPSGRLAPGPFGRYRLLRLIGVGGMGEVYEAEQDNPRRRVALKVIRADLLSSEVAARFDNEALILGRLRHPGIAQIYEAGTTDSHGAPLPYFAMELVDGRPLIEFAHAAGLQMRGRLEIFIRVCEAVEHAHRMGVIHRDLKPSNILVDAAGQPRVLDFGVARATDSDLQASSFQTDIGRLVGTLAYMSPEQVSGDPTNLDTRSDVYALGVLLYELLSGRPPYQIDAARIHESARVITQTEPGPLGATDRALRGDVQTIVSKALAKERDRRYQSVGGLAADIRRYLKDEPIEARPASAAYQIAMFSRRHKAVVVASAIVLASVLGAAVVSTVFAFGESAAKVEAQARARALEEEEAITAEISDFLQSTFVALAPKRLGRDAKVVDAVRQGIQRLENGPPQNPQVEAPLRHAFGYALMQLGDFDLAVNQLQRSRELLIQVTGPRNEDAIVVSIDLAFALSDAGRVIEAEALLREIVDIRAELHGPEDAFTLASKNDLAECLMRQERFAEAEPILEELLKVKTRVEGIDSASTVGTMHNLAAAYGKLGKTEDALRLARKVLDHEAAVDENSVDYLSAAEMVAMLECASGRLDDAEAMLRRILDAKRKIYGEDHLQVFITRGNLAETYLGQGKPREAETEFRSLMADEERRIGITHPHYISTVIQLAGALADQDLHTDSLSTMDDLLADIREAPNVTPLTLASCRLERADCLRMCGRWEEAATEGMSAWAVFVADPNATHHKRVKTARLLVVVLDHLGRQDEANIFCTYLVEKGEPMPRDGDSPRSK